MLKKAETGQSLIEVLIVLVIAALMIIGLTMVVLSSLRNAQFAENQIKATKFAQEGIDKLRVMRDINKSGSLIDKNLPPNSYCFASLWNLESNFSCTSDCYFKIENNNLIQKNSLADSAENLTGNFKRYIVISNPQNSDKERVVNIKVGWEDSTGTHESNIQTILIAPSFNDCEEQI